MLALAEPSTHDYEQNEFNEFFFFCRIYDVEQRIVPTCSDLPLGVSPVSEKVAVTGDCLPTGTNHHFVCYTGRDIGGYGPKVSDIGATASKSACISSVSDMGNSANVNPPAKSSRADRTPIRSSECSPTGGGIPSGSSAMHSETMGDVDEMSLAASEGDWHPTLTNPSSTPSSRVQDEAEVMSSVLTRGYVVHEASGISRDVCFPATQDHFGSGSCAPTGGTPEAEVEGETSTPSATFSREGTLTGRPQGEQHRARTFTATALIAEDTLHWTVPGKPDLTPWRGVGSYTHDSYHHSQTDSGCSCPAGQYLESVQPSSHSTHAHYRQQSGHDGGHWQHPADLTQRAFTLEYNLGFKILYKLHCWCYDVLQRIVPTCSDLPLGVSAVPEV
ncbi:hypothetical protein E1301_Tti001841 [Triplophysa tibetana]|uniref:Uncharacterized protein n=1 Tax=Triplophysa tibetana TaxID=1572043 RepID=A0A5A9P9T7_9TELE|nr:hypothetical protein E1301_Tti001841 [Triplophysa tibetana]